MAAIGHPWAPIDTPLAPVGHPLALFGTRWAPRRVHYGRNRPTLAAPKGLQVARGVSNIYIPPVLEPNIAKNGAKNNKILYVQTCIELGDKRLHSISNRDYWCHQPGGFQHQFTTAVDRGTHEIELASDPGETKPVEITEPTRPSYRIHCLLTVSSSFP